MYLTNGIVWYFVLVSSVISIAVISIDGTIEFALLLHLSMLEFHQTNKNSEEQMYTKSEKRSFTDAFLPFQHLSINVGLVSFPFIYTLLYSAWNNQSIPEWIWQGLSTNKTSSHTSLTLTPETGRQGEENTVWLLCGNPDYLLMHFSLSIVGNPLKTTFSLFPPPVQLTYTWRKGKKRGKLEKYSDLSHNACPLVSRSRKSDECTPFTLVSSTHTNMSMYTQCYSEKFHLVDWGHNLWWLKNVGRLEPWSNNGLNQGTHAWFIVHKYC